MATAGEVTVVEKPAPYPGLMLGGGVYAGKPLLRLNAGSPLVSEVKLGVAEKPTVPVPR